MNSFSASALVVHTTQCTVTDTLLNKNSHNKTETKPKQEAEPVSNKPSSNAANLKKTHFNIIPNLPNQEGNKDFINETQFYHKLDFISTFLWFVFVVLGYTSTSFRFLCNAAASVDSFYCETLTGRTEFQHVSSKVQLKQVS